MISLKTLLHVKQAIMHIDTRSCVSIRMEEDEAAGRVGEGDWACEACRGVFLVKDKTRDEFGRLRNTGVMEEIYHSEWAVPCVIVKKLNGASIQN